VPVVAQGVDYAFSHPSIASLVANGKSFAVRYLFPFSQNPGTKNLTRGEADQLNAALTHGVVSNYESYAERAAEGFAAGVADARAADAQHRACGGPPTRPIYFSVDFDPVASQYPGIADYFRGIISVIGLARTGAYGSYNMIKYLFDQHLIAWGWQTYAWSGGKYDERCQLSQDKNGVPMGGGEVDLDAAHAEDFGQWKYKGTPGGDDMSAQDVKDILAGFDHRLIRTMAWLVNGGLNMYVNPQYDVPAQGSFPASPDAWKSILAAPATTTLNELAHGHTLMYRGDTDDKGQAKPPGQNTHPANLEFIYKALTQRQRLVKAPSAGAVYYGDHLVRRWIDDPAELAKLQEHLRNAGLDPNVYTLAAGEQLDTWGVLVGKDPYPPKDEDVPVPPAPPAAG
jgi:hypothetical protein